MSTTKTILGVIAGASLGAIAGILLAPESGKATRKKIKDKLGEWKDAVSGKLDDFLNKVEEGVKQEFGGEQRPDIPSVKDDSI